MHSRCAVKCSEMAMPNVMHSTARKSTLDWSLLVGIGQYRPIEFPPAGIVMPGGWVDAGDPNTWMDALRMFIAAMLRKSMAIMLQFHGIDTMSWSMTISMLMKPPATPVVSVGPPITDGVPDADGWAIDSRTEPCKLGTVESKYWAGLSSPAPVIWRMSFWVV